MSKNNKNTQTISYQNVPLDQIVVSPHNDGRGEFIDPDGLIELADSIKAHGVLQAVLLRPVGDQYELVVGERRFRASKIAGLETIKAEIRELSDEQVLEIQIIENFQREQPHPMVEARAFSKMLSFKTKALTAEEISAKIGKSPSYIYVRIKLNNLVETFQQIFLANKITLTQAIRLSRLDKDSQNDFISSYCEQWEEDTWVLNNFNYKIQNFQLDLDDAPFDIADAKLDKAAGSCNKCQHNTAVTTSLFPDDSSDARCTNRVCYQNKCRLASSMAVRLAITENPDLPIAVDSLEDFYNIIPATDRAIANTPALVRGVDFDSWDEQDAPPKIEDYDYYDEEDERQEEFQYAQQEYEHSLERLNRDIADGTVIKAISGEADSAGKIVYLSKFQAQSISESRSGRTEFKAKDYQEALKTKSLTVDILAAEKERILEREERAKEIDQQKLQELYVSTLAQSEAFSNPEFPVGKNDRAAMIFILFDSIGYWNSKKYRELITGANEDDDDYNDEFDLLLFVQTATDEQVSVLIRHALLNLGSVKSAGTNAAKVLRHLMEGTSGINTAELDQQQQSIADERSNKLQAKLSILDKQADKLQPVTA